MGLSKRLAVRLGVITAFLLVCNLHGALAAGVHDRSGIVWAVRKPASEPAPGPGLIQSLPQAMSSADSADTAPANAPQAIADRTGIAANVIVRARAARMDRAALDGLVPSSVPLARSKSALSGPLMRLALFGDADIQVVPQSMQRMADGYLVWTGTVLGEAGSSVSLVIKDGAVTGDIFMAGRSFKIRATGAAKAGTGADIRHEIIEVDENAYTHGAANAPKRARLPEGLAPNDPAPSEVQPAAPPADAAAKGTKGAALGSTPSVATALAAAASINIPILVAYTPTVAQQAAASGQDVRALIQSAMSTVNTVWSNSGVNAVAVPNIVVTDSDIPDGGSYTLADHLNFISGFYAGPAAGYGKLRQLRDTQGAALVQLIVAPGTADTFCGIASVPDRPVSSSDQTTAFSAVRNDCLGTTNAHEIGHNLSLNHDRITDGITDQSVYNVGWIDKTALSRDVMAYREPCPSCQLQRLYSNPLLTVKGVAFGVAAGGVDPADGVRAVNESLAAIAAYRSAPIASPDANQVELAVKLTTAAPQGSTAIANAQGGQLCAPTTTGTGTVWFTHTPGITGTSSFTLSNIKGSDVICAYPAPPRGSVTYTAAGSTSPTYYPSVRVRASNASTNLQISLAGTAGTPIYVGVNSLTSSSLPIIGRAVTAVPQNGWWWDPAYPGIGFALETSASGNGVPTMFIAGFFYDVAGNPVWGVSLGSMTDAANYSGALTGYSGGNPYGSATKATTGTTAYGNIALNFTSPTAGSLQWAGGTLKLQRFSVDSKPIDYTAATGSPGFDSGWYWINNDGGRGAFIEQMGTSQFAALFQYDSTGKPTWQIVTGSKVSNGSWQGTLTDYTGGTAPTTAFRTATQRNSFGTATFTTSSPSGAYNVIFNKAAPNAYPSTYFSYFNLSVALPGVSSRLAMERYRF